MIVHVDSQAQEYIRQNGYRAMVFLGTMRGCCGGASPVPKIFLGSPKDVHGYEENKIGNITIFVDKNLEGTRRVRVTYAKFLWVNKLSVEVDQ